MDAFREYEGQVDQNKYYQWFQLTAMAGKFHNESWNESNDHSNEEASKNYK